MPVQYCVRDLHHNHVLFADEESPRVTGLVDYDAVRVDSVVADIARLLRSLLNCGPATWEEALIQYAKFRPLNEAEFRLLAVYDEANRLLSGIQWLDWIVLQRRQFAWQPVLARLEILASRL